MFPLIPYKRLVLESPLSLEEAVRRLTLDVAEPVWGMQWREKRTQTFEGAVSHEGFKITRIIRHRNSFRPVISGSFHPHANGVRVEVTMRLHVAVMIFSLFWLSIVGLMAAAATVAFLSPGRVQPDSLIPLGMLVFFYLMTTIGFGVEVNKAGRLLTDLLEARDERVGSIGPAL